jgi:hypothetical protein
MHLLRVMPNQNYEPGGILLPDGVLLQTLFIPDDLSSLLNELY